MLDLCEAFFKVHHSKKFGEIFNTGTGQNLSIKELYYKICSILEIKKPLEVQNKRKRKITSEVTSLRCNNKKISKLGWKPKIKFNSGLKKTIKWISNNQSIYKDIYNI